MRWEGGKRIGVLLLTLEVFYHGGREGEGVRLLAYALLVETVGDHELREVTDDFR